MHNAVRHRDKELVATYAGLLQSRVLAPPPGSGNKAAGLVYHLADIIVPELRNCCAPGGDANPEPALAGRRAAGGKRPRGGGGEVQQPPGGVIEALLAPFLEALRMADEKAAIARIK